MVKSVYFTGVKFSGYSNWHRQQHNCLGFSDIDQVGTCNSCLEPLFLAETVFNNGQDFIKPHQITKRLAVMAGIPAFIIWYKLVADMMIFVHVKRIAPDYQTRINNNHFGFDGYSSGPIRLSPDQWLQYLEYKQVQHFPDCKKKELFIKKLKEDPRANRRKAFATILY
jgi:hypothetical protein